MTDAAATRSLVRWLSLAVFLNSAVIGVVLSGRDSAKLVLTSIGIAKATPTTHSALDARTHRRNIDRLRASEKGIVRRSKLSLRSGDLVLLEPPLKLGEAKETWEWLTGDSSTIDDDLMLYPTSEQSPWYVPEERPEQLTTFNCASYALGDVIGLSKSDWLHPRVDDWTEGKSPAQVVLNEHFELIETVTVEGLDHTDSPLRRFENRKTLRERDVIAFVKNGAEGEFTHFGMIQRVKGRRVLVSKLGIGPILMGSVHATALRYRGQFQQVRVYRRRDTATKHT